jgi:hypothetical protein
MATVHPSTANPTGDRPESTFAEAEAPKAADQRLPVLADFSNPLQTIDQALNAIRDQQNALKQVQDSGYDSEKIQKQFDALTEIHVQIKPLISPLFQRLPETAASLQSNSESVQTLLDQRSQYFSAHAITADRLTIRKHLYEITSQLSLILEKLSLDVNDLRPDAESVVESASEISSLSTTLDKLQADLAREKRAILMGDFGQAQKSLILKRLHQLSLLLCRLRQLSYQPRMAKQKDILAMMAIQIKDTVDSLDFQASNAADLLEETACVIHRQVNRYEYNRYCLPVGWLINRYQDIKRLESVQARVLTGLIFSLLFSGGIFLVGTVMLTILSAYESASETSIRNTIDAQRKDLITAVQTFLENETALETKQTQITNLNTQIEQQSNRLADLRRQSLELTPSISPTLSPESLPVDTATENQQPPQDVGITPDTDLQVLETERAGLSQQKIDLELKRQTMRSNINRILAELQSLQSQLANQTNEESLAPSWTGRSLKAAASFVNNKNLLNHLRRIILAAFAGAIGSMMSILIRLDKLDEENIKNPFLLGALKPVIGAVFGIAVFAITKSNRMIKGLIPMDLIRLRPHLLLLEPIP